MTETTHQYFSRINRQRNVRKVLIAAARKLCTCTHTKSEHQFGQKCGMRGCRCRQWVAA